MPDPDARAEPVSPPIRPLALTLLVLTAGGSGCGSAKVPLSQVATVELSFPLEDRAPPQIELQFHKGLVIAVPGDTLQCQALVDVSGPTVEECRELAQQIAPRIEYSDDTARLTLVQPEGAAMESIHVRYQLQVPATVGLRVQTAIGEVHLRGLEGRVVAITDSGSIHARIAGGEAELRSRSGPVALEGSFVNAYLESGTGRLEATLPAGGAIELRTVTGPILVQVPDDLQVHLYYDGARADLRTDLPLEWVAGDGPGSMPTSPKIKSFDAVLGPGNAESSSTVRIQSAGGAVQFRRRAL